MRFALIAVLALSSQAQVKTFEAATVRRTEDLNGPARYQTFPGRISLQGETLKECIRVAYNVKVVQTAGNAKWTETERFDIEAKAARPVGDNELLMMLQGLLKERFKLDVHRESRMVAGFAIAQAKGGIKIHEVEPGAAHIQTRRGLINAERISMPNLATALSAMLNAPVLDMTGAAGVYDFSLTWTADMVRPGQLTADEPEQQSAQPDNITPASLFAAIQEQLGLRLESRKAPADVMIVDRVERLK